MRNRPSTAAERTSIGMEVVAVAVGVGYGVADSIARRTHRHEPARRPVAHHDDARARRTAPAAHGFAHRA